VVRVGGPAIVICDIVVNGQTDRHTRTQTPLIQLLFMWEPHR